MPGADAGWRHWVCCGLPSWPLADTGENDHAGPASHTFWGAMKTIIVADALMGIRQRAGCGWRWARRSDLVIIGCLVSIPIVVFGSYGGLRLVERFPLIIHLGAAAFWHLPGGQHDHWRTAAGSGVRPAGAGTAALRAVAIVSVCFWPLAQEPDAHPATWAEVRQAAETMFVPSPSTRPERFRTRSLCTWTTRPTHAADPEGCWVARPQTHWELVACPAG